MSDFVIHDFCLISTHDGLNPTFPGEEPGFDLSQCEKRCSNDPFCKGYTTYTANYNNSAPGFEPIVFSYDACFLFTNSSTSSLCTHSTYNSGTNATFAIGPIDPNALCAGNNEDPALSETYYEGCHIKSEDIQGKFLLLD